jgi:glycine cleavage system protein P-like pyridoxal-binding family
MARCWWWCSPRRFLSGWLEPPRDADIVCGELQSFAISPSYGGPYAGVMATKEKFIRQIPGRLVGQTKDNRGNRAFCLTLATREQHIRREKATSNICTNQALIALMATVFMTVYGKEGLRELAEQNLAKAHYLGAQTPRTFTSPYFNEFVAKPKRSAAVVNDELLTKGIIGGLDLGRFYPELSGHLLLWRHGDVEASRDGCGCGGDQRMIRKVRPHINQNEGLVFEISSPGKKGYQLPDLDVPLSMPQKRLAPAMCAMRITDFPEVSEVETIRHFTRLSTQNYGSTSACSRSVPAR